MSKKAADPGGFLLLSRKNLNRWKKHLSTLARVGFGSEFDSTMKGEISAYSPYFLELHSLL